MKRATFMLLIAGLMVVGGCKKQKEEAQKTQPEKPAPLIEIVKDTTQWHEILETKTPVMVAFVSNRLSGAEKAAFYNTFRAAALRYRKNIRFLYVNCDDDHMWIIYDRLNPFSLRQIPLVASIDADGELLEAYANPPQSTIEQMAQRCMELSGGESGGDTTKTGQ